MIYIRILSSATICLIFIFILFILFYFYFIFLMLFVGMVNWVIPTVGPKKKIWLPTRAASSNSCKTRIINFTKVLCCCSLKTLCHKGKRNVPKKLRELLVLIYYKKCLTLKMKILSGFICYIFIYFESFLKSVIHLLCHLSEFI